MNLKKFREVTAGMPDETVIDIYHPDLCLTKSIPATYASSMFSDFNKLPIIVIGCGKILIEKEEIWSDKGGG